MEKGIRLSINPTYISKYRTEIMGLAAVLLVIGHLIHTGAAELPFGKLNKLLEIVCFTGTDIFVILSGFGCYFALQKKPSYKDWLKKRFLRIMVPFWIITIPINLIKGMKSPGEWLTTESTLYYWINGGSGKGMWYVSFILAVYILLPFAFALLSSDDETKTTRNFLLALCVCFCGIFFVMSLFSEFAVKYSYALYRIPSVFVGLWGYRIDKGKHVSILLVIGLCTIILLKLLVNHMGHRLPFEESYQMLVLSTLVIISATWIFDKTYGSIHKSIVLHGIGTCSLEIYLSHMDMIDIFKHYGAIPYFLSVGLVVVAAHFLSNVIIEKLS